MDTNQCAKVWEGMNAHESKKQFIWYLDEYAVTPSGRQDCISRWNRGGSKLMAIAANSVQNDIFVLAYNTDGQQKLHCSLFRLSTTTRGNKVYETGQQVLMHLNQCIAGKTTRIETTTRAEILRETLPGISAFVHTGPLPIRKMETTGQVCRLLALLISSASQIPTQEIHRVLQVDIHDDSNIDTN
ncbi:unnamed protein product [Peronospora farinosa]|uniref:PiggyBac transposable element-derived protein domain-containing protein n=1 Tax=Peronospora farinosa TaxID=134698 RepID=A0AAV0SQ36_9STRA|nr:unnamed protein product [Peronospora farinosa]